MSRGLRLAVALPCLSAALACTASDLTADAGVTVTGKADLPDGGPFAGAKLVLIKEPDLGEAIGGVFEVAATLGLACLSSNAPVICEQGFMGTTAADGDFSFSLTGAQTQGSVDDADTFLLTTQDVPASGQLGGASVTEEFIINATALALPDLRLWEPALAFAGTATSVTMTFGALPSDYGSDPQTGVTFTAQDSAQVWSQPATSGEAIDARLLEDATGSVSATATADGEAADTSVTFDYQSGSVAFAGTAGPPPSRGAACFEQGMSGAVPLMPCTLTSGDFATVVPLQTCGAPSCATLNNWAYVDLGSSKSFSLVVVRGPVNPCVVESSPDAMTWTAVSTTAQSGIFSVSGSGTARYVRVRAQSASDDVSGLTQISVW